MFHTATNPQRGYISLVVIVFLIILSMVLFPYGPPPPGASIGCHSGVEPSEYKEVILPALSIDGPILGEDGSETVAPKEKYVLIRKNVPITTHLTAFDASSYLPSGDQQVHFVGWSSPEFPNERILYPRRAGEHTVQKPFRNDPTKNLIGFDDEKFIFFLHMKAVQTPSVYGIRPSVGEYSLNQPFENILVVDVYQEISQYNQVKNGEKYYTYEEVFDCDEQGPIKEITQEEIDRIIGNWSESTGQAAPAVNPPEAAGEQVIVPPQSVSLTRDQLQLEWFLFDESQGVWGSHCKPAVYLYPEKKQLVNVKVSPRGELSYTDPPYDPGKGWTVWAEPDGKLHSIYDLRFTIYDYLYYESKLRNEEIEKPETGWVVKFNDLESFYDDVLPRLGLNQKEAGDFKEYWLKTLPQSPYYFVGVVGKNQRDYLELLTVTPAPQTSIRFSLYFEALDQPKVVEEPEITTPVRRGFTLVDWGGMVKLHPDTPFTCSQ